jgi:hypothetical protein
MGRESGSGRELLRVRERRGCYTSKGRLWANIWVWALYLFIEVTLLKCQGRRDRAVATTHQATSANAALERGVLEGARVVVRIGGVGHGRRRTKWAKKPRKNGRVSS